MLNVIWLRDRHQAARKEARVSKVKGRPDRAARSTKAGQRAGGIPRRRQVLTVVSSTPSAAATPELPPKPSMIAPGVMEDTIVGMPPTCQGLANGPLTKNGTYVPIRAMGDEAKAIGNRLERTRLALGYEHAIDFANEIGVDKGDYSKFESGKRPLTLRVARKIKKRWGVSLDWLMDGDIHTLRRDLAEEIIKLREVA